MIFETLVVGPLQCNCIIVGCEKTCEALVVDPGDEADRILEVLEHHHLRVTGILHTHAHFDHVGATRSLKEKTGATVSLHKEDTFLYEHLSQQAAMFGLKAPEPVAIEQWFREGDTVSAGTLSARVLHTPGHSPGSVCFQLPDKLLSGDTLFAGSIGRTDLWGGSMDQILESIKTKIMALPDDTEVYPGHGPATTIGRERQTNPFLQGYF